MSLLAAKRCAAVCVQPSFRISEGGKGGLRGLSVGEQLPVIHYFDCQRHTELLESHKGRDGERNQVLLLARESLCQMNSAVKKKSGDGTDAASAASELSLLVFGIEDLGTQKPVPVGNPSQKKAHDET